MKSLSTRIYNLINLNKFYKINLKYFITSYKNSKNNFLDKAINISSSVEEPEEYRTIYIENLPIDWDENEIKLRLEQLGEISKLHLIKNTLGDSLGKG